MKEKDEGGRMKDEKNGLRIAECGLRVVKSKTIRNSQSAFRN